MNKVILKIDGMSCSACQATVEKYLNRQDGVCASVNLVMGQALIEYDSSKVTIDDLNRFVKESGYKSLGIYDGTLENKKDNSKMLLIVFGIVVVILMMVSMFHMMGFFAILMNPFWYGIILLFLTIPFLIYGLDILKSGVVKLFHRRANMDSLVSVGVLASFLYSFIQLLFIIFHYKMIDIHLYFESSAMIVYFIKLGRYIDRESKQKTKKAIRELVQITPKSALLKDKSGQREVTIDEVNKGDILICKPGMRIAVDGVIVKGYAHLDESFITGESRRYKRSVHDNVIAGSVNIDGYIEYRAVRIGKDSTISEIVRLVMEASNKKAPIQKIADSVSGYFVPGVMLIALLTFIFYLLLGNPFHEAIISFVTVLVVACPCALGLATPLAVVISEGVAAKSGILIKSSEILENTYKVDTIIFDKTGTLTYGTPRISKVYNYSHYSESELIRLVSSLEEKSSHPIAFTFRNYILDTKMKLVDVSSFQNIPGIGLFGIVNQKNLYVGNDKLFHRLGMKNLYGDIARKLSLDGNSIIYVIEDKNVIGLIGIQDVIRKDARKTVDRLKKMNIKIVMMSGDNKEISSLVAKRLRIQDVISDCLPQEKEKEMMRIKQSGSKVMMVGDGINDAPSLAMADIGVSVNGGTDIAADSSDVILMNDNLEKIVSLLLISKRTVTVIRQNLFWAFFYNLCMIPIAIGVFSDFGIRLNPMMASFAMMVSSLSVVFNSLRLNKNVY